MDTEDGYTKRQRLLINCQFGKRLRVQQQEVDVVLTTALDKIAYSFSEGNMKESSVIFERIRLSPMHGVAGLELSAD